MAVYEKVSCIHCGNNYVRKYGKVKDVQRYQCHTGCGKTFKLDYAYKAWRPGTDKKVIDIAMNGGGIRDTARILSISTMTVMSILKKKPVI